MPLLNALEQGAFKTIWHVHTLPGLHSAIIRAAEDASRPCCNRAHPAWAIFIPVTPLPGEKNVSLSVLCGVGAASPVIVGVFLLWLRWLDCKYVLYFQHCLLQKGYSSTRAGRSGIEEAIMRCMLSVRGNRHSCAKTRRRRSHSRDLVLKKELLELLPYEVALNEEVKGPLGLCTNISTPSDSAAETLY